MSQSPSRITALDDARSAVERSDKAQRTRSQPWTTDATLGETLALRDALRALIQYVEGMDDRLRELEARGKPS